MRIPALLLLLSAAPAAANPGDPLVLYLSNAGSVMMEEAVLFPVSEDGSIVDDVLTARHEAVAADDTVALDTRLRSCGRISVWARFAGGREASAIVDLCHDPHLTLHD